MKKTAKKIKSADMSECPDCLQPTSKHELIANYGLCVDCVGYLLEKIDSKKKPMGKELTAEDLKRIFNSKE